MAYVKSIPFRSAAEITPSDAGIVVAADAFLASVSVAGAVKVRLAGGDDVVLQVTVGTTKFDLSVTRVWTTGTTATGRFYNLG